MRHDKPTLRDSLWGLIAGTAKPVRSRERQELVRVRMLEELLSIPLTGSGPLATRIRGAADAEDLWHLRSGLMQALCRARGEAQACEVMAELTELFDGLLPAALTTASTGGRLRKAFSGGASWGR